MWKKNRSLYKRLIVKASLEEIQFFKQGPPYKKEGPDPNKGSNQQ